jgi:hypothetical protein
LSPSYREENVVLSKLFTAHWDGGGSPNDYPSGGGIARVGVFPAVHVTDRVTWGQWFSLSVRLSPLDKARKGIFASLYLL